MIPRRRSSSTTCSASTSGGALSVGSRISGSSGSSYGASTPVKLRICPASARAVQPLRVAPPAFVHRGVDEDLQELAFLDTVARQHALGAVGRDERHQHDQPGLDEQLRHLGDAADVLHPVGLGETRGRGSARAARCRRPGSWCGGPARAAPSPPDWRWSTCRRRQPGEPQHRRLLAHQRGARLPCRTSRRCQWMLAGAGAQVGHHAGADRVARQPVDQDEAAQFAARPRSARTATRCASEIVTRPISFSASSRTGTSASVSTSSRLVISVIVPTTAARAEHEQIGAAAEQRRLVHPHHPGGHLVGQRRRRRDRQHVAARDVDLAIQHQRHRLAGRPLRPGRRPW